MQPRPVEPFTIAARVRWLLARHRRTVRIVVAVACVCLIVGQWRASHALDLARRAWGTDQLVWVASQNIAAGQPLLAQQRTVPAPVAPTSAVHAIPHGARASHAIARGEILVTTDLTGATTLPADWVVFAIATDSLPALLAGDPVAVYGSGVHLCDGVATHDHPASASGTSMAGTSTAAEIGVPRSCAPAVGDQLATHSVQVGKLSRGASVSQAG